MISTAITMLTPACTPPDDPPPVCADAAIPNLYVAQRLLRRHQSHTVGSNRPCPAWMAATAYLSAGCGDYE